MGVSGHTPEETSHAKVQVCKSMGDSKTKGSREDAELGRGRVGRGERSPRDNSKRLACDTEVLYSADADASVNEGGPLARKDLAPSPLPKPTPTGQGSSALVWPWGSSRWGQPHLGLNALELKLSFSFLSTCYDLRQPLKLLMPRVHPRPVTSDQGRIHAVFFKAPEGIPIEPRLKTLCQKDKGSRGWGEGESVATEGFLRQGTYQLH